jgi:hypothetical protein
LSIFPTLTRMMTLDEPWPPIAPPANGLLQEQTSQWKLSLQSMFPVQHHLAVTASRPAQLLLINGYLRGLRPLLSVCPFPTGSLLISSCLQVYRSHVPSSSGSLYGQTASHNARAPLSPDRRKQSTLNGSSFMTKLLLANPSVRTSAPSGASPREAGSPRRASPAPHPCQYLILFSTDFNDFVACPLNPHNGICPIHGRESL